MAKKPLMLKDHLELESNSEAFRLAPLTHAAGTTLRSLLDTELRSDGVAGQEGSTNLLRSYSKSALTRFSNVIKAVNALHFFTTGSKNPASSLLHKSFSKKLRCGFWKRSVSEKESGWRSLSEEDVEITSSLFSPSPVVSSCRSSSDGGGSTCFDFLLFSTASSPQKEMFDGVGETFHRASPDNRDPKENCGNGKDCPMEEEKEQFSPVSVLEFPYKDEDDDDEVEQPSTISPCSPQNLTCSIDTPTNQLQPFVNRAELDPVDLVHQFACSETPVPLSDEDEEEQRWRKAFSLLYEVAGGESLPAMEENFLFEFFLEGLSLSEHCRRWRSRSHREEELMRVAAAWVSGEVWGVENGVDVVVAEMEMTGGWRRFEEDSDMVAAEISCGLMTWLMEELAGELLLIV